MRDDPKDPRGARSIGWDHSVPLYPIALPDAPPGTQLAAGTDYPGREGKSSFVVHLELTEALTERQGAKLARAVYRAVMKQSLENRQWSAAAQLGGEDALSNLPRNMAFGNEAYCFWMMLTEFPKPVLAIRTAFRRKDALKKVFDKCWTETRNSDGQFTKGWRAEAKLWWCYGEHAYPTVLGRLRGQGFKLKWINRPGFPPAPPVEST